MWKKDGHYSIKTNVYEFLKDFRTGIINSDILGYAFEPEQRFEDPDGSTIIFDQLCVCPSCNSSRSLK